MSEFFSLGVLHPLGLWFLAPILGGLFYAYLRERKLKPIVIPSLFLLKDLTAKATTRHRFLPPWRFWLELFVLSLLLLCLAGLFRSIEQTNYALIVDNSLSTMVTDGSSTVLDRIKEEASATASSFPAGAVFDLYRTSPSLERIGGGELKKSEINTALGKIKSVYGVDSFNDQIAQVTQRGNYNGTIVVTDRQLEIADPQEKKDELSLRSVSLSGEKISENIALSHASFEPSIDVVEQGVVKVVVTSYASKAAELTLILEQLSPDRSRWLAATSLPVKLAARETKEVVFSPQKLGSIGARVRIDPESTPAQQNALTQDDVQYLSFKQQNNSVYVVSARSVRDLGIGMIRGTKFKQLEPEEYEKSLSFPDSSTYLLVDFVPDGLPNKNVIIISPPKGTAGFGVSPVVPSAEVTEWNAGHPLLTYIDIPSLKFSRFLPISIPLWGEAIVSTNRGAAMMAGVVGNRRVVVAGFDLFPYRGSGSPTISVLFLNMLNWVNRGHSGDSSRPFEGISVPQNTATFSYANTLGNGVFPNWKMGDKTFVPEMPGLYFAQSEGGGLSSFAVNFSSAHESDISSRQEKVSARPSSAAPEKIRQQQSLADYLAPLIILILLVDFIFLVRRALKSNRSVFAKRKRVAQ